MALTYLTADRLNQFLPRTKWQLSTTEAADEDELERITSSIVLGTLSRRYDVSTWVGSGSTPSLVLDIMAMYMAGRLFNRQFVEDQTEATEYGNGLVNDALNLLRQIVEELVDVYVSPGVLAVERIPPTHEQPLYQASDPVFLMETVF